MSFRKRLALFLAVVLLATAIGALLAPFAVARGLRLWLSWAAREEGLNITIGKIDAPFLQPVTIDELRVSPANEKAREIRLQASRVLLDLNLRGRIFSQHARFLHALEIGRISGSIRQSRERRGEKLDWRNLQRLLPDSVHLENVDLDISTPATVFAFRGLALSASEIESGKFFAHKIFVTSPMLRQTFTDLRGATSWETDHLTIAGISLARGLDLEALAIDFSGLTSRQIGIDFNLDTFGGTLRASFHGRGGGEKFAVELAGSAANISLAQLSGAAGFLEPLQGSIRAAKFTFRGNPGEFLDATASIWIEAGDFAWRNRRADNVVFGATYYDRRFQLEQLYLQQRRNELTINGEFRWPKPPIDWTALPFRGQLNANLPDADSFAQLFGAKAGDFSGALSATGEIDLLDPAARGRLDLKGEGTGFRGVAFDSLGANFQLQGADATLTSLELRHKNDFLRAEGNINLKTPHHYSARLTGAINDLAAYAPVLPTSWRSATLAGGLTFDWTSDGTFGAHSGTMQLFAHGLELPIAPLRSPFDLTLEGTYSPEDVFFRTFRLANRRLSLGGFVMLGRNFVELQGLELLLDGAPRASGTLFLPIGVDRWRKTGSLFAAFDERQKFDIDFHVEQLNLADLSAALGESASTSGLLDGKLAAYGPIASLQVTSDLQLKNLGPAEADNLLAGDLHYDAGRAEANLRATFGVSSPLIAQVSLPLRLEKKYLADISVISPVERFSATLDFPALFLAMVPKALQPLGARSGFLSGEIDYRGTFEKPQINGEARIFSASFNPAPPLPEVANLTATLSIEKSQAAIAPLWFNASGILFQGSGSLTMTPPFFAFTFAPLENSIALARLPASGEEVSAIRVLGEGKVADGPILDRAIVRGKFGSPFFSLTMASTDPAQTTLFFNPQSFGVAGPLLLDVVRKNRASPTLELRRAPPPESGGD